MSRPLRPRVVRAPNPGPFTLDGTRTFLVGLHRVAVVDPGPAVPGHVSALVSALEGAREAVILVTHDHADHAGAASELRRRTGAPVLGAWEGADRTLGEGDAVETDQGELVAIEAPGHADRHLVFHWPAGGGLFAGDLLLGEGTTTWVGGYPGCVADYLSSLDRVEALAPAVVYPAHGPAIEDVTARIGLFREHRLERIRQVEAVLADGVPGSPERIVERVYGSDLPSDLREAARASVQAILEHLAER